MKKTLAALLAAVLLLGCLLTGCGLTVLSGDGPEETPVLTENAGEPELSEDGSYTSREDVAAYLLQYHRLPDNFITKKEAKKLGWDRGDLWEAAPGKSIGGDRFGNYEGLLPEKEGRQYYECDIDYTGGSRGAKRIVYSDDGLIYYTEDHYQSFILLYGDE